MKVLIDKESYEEGINDIENILKGNITGVIKHLEDVMSEKATSLDFEEAQRIKEKYDSLKRYQSKSTDCVPI